MIIPNVSSQYSPGPDTRMVIIPSTRSCAPQIEEESRQVEYRLVHEITCEASKKGENARVSGFKPVTYCWVGNRGSVGEKGVGGVGLAGQI